MTSKKTPPDKRASLPRKANYTKTFLKDWERLSHSGRFDLKRLKTVILQLVANDSPLGPEWRDHALLGNKDCFRECHIGGDFLLIYQVVEKENAILFVRAGTHSELFG